MQSADQVKAAQQEAETMKRETALAAAALEGRAQTLTRQETAAAEARAVLQTRTRELDSREVNTQLSCLTCCFRLHACVDSLMCLHTAICDLVHAANGSPVGRSSLSLLLPRYAELWPAHILEP